MATRLLLTLLALLTGLAAQLSPAQARTGASVETEIGVVAAQRVVERRLIALAWVPPAQTDRRVLLESGGNGVGASAVPVRTVLPGVDRARE